MTAIRLAFLGIVIVAGILVHDSYRRQQTIKSLNVECSRLFADVMEARMIAISAMSDATQQKHQNELLERQVRWLEAMRTQ